MSKATFTAGPEKTPIVIIDGRALRLALGRELTESERLYWERLQ